MDKFSYISNAHVAYIDELYSDYKNNPESIDLSWKVFFDGFDFAIAKYGEDQGTPPASKSPEGSKESVNGSLLTPGTIMDMEQLPKEIKVRALIHAYRSRAHLRSKTNPVRERRDRKALLDIEDFGLDQNDLNTEFQAGKEIGIGTVKLSKLIESLKIIYEGAIGFEYTYIRDPEMLDWLKTKFEKEALSFNPSVDAKKRILFKLNQAVVFENFLHNRANFIQAHRFVKIFVGAQIHRLKIRLDTTIGRDHDHTCTREFTAQFTQKNQAVHIRHIDVADNQVDLVLPEQIEGIIAICSTFNLVTIL